MPNRVSKQPKRPDKWDKAEIERAVQPLREALEAGMLLLDTIYPDDVFTGESGDEGALLVKDFRDAARAALRPQTVAEEL